MSANGFVATTSSATTLSARRAPRVPGELLLRADGPPRQEPVAGDDPAEPGERGEPEQRAGRPVHAVERRRPRGAAAPRAEEREEAEERAAPEPEAEAAAVAAERGRDADPAPPAAGEEVDGDREERAGAPRSSTSSIAQPRTTRLPR